MSDIREGEIRLDAPLQMRAELCFVGHVESPWKTRADCPRNLRAARERGQPATLHIAPEFRPALDGIAPGDVVVALYWMTEARRDLLRQVPRHRPDGAGTFALRSPARPNPIGMGVVRVLALDANAGRVEIDAIDALDGTPLIDLKPHMPAADLSGS